MPYLKKIPPLGPCPLEAVLLIIGGKWKVRILRCLADRPRTFGHLKGELTGISQQVLATALKALKSDEMVRRQTAPSPVGRGSLCVLTEDARGLLGALENLATWGADRLRARGLEWPKGQGPLSQPSPVRQAPKSGRGRAIVS